MWLLKQDYLISRLFFICIVNEKNTIFLWAPLFNNVDEIS